MTWRHSRSQALSQAAIIGWNTTREYRRTEGFTSAAKFLGESVLPSSTIKAIKAMFREWNEIEPSIFRLGKIWRENEIGRLWQKSGILERIYWIQE